MISYDELRKTAQLAKLYINEEEINSLNSEINELIAFVSEITKFNTDKKDKLESILLNNLREDSLQSSLPSEVITDNATKKENGYFTLEANMHE